MPWKLYNNPNKYFTSLTQIQPVSQTLLPESKHGSKDLGITGPDETDSLSKWLFHSKMVQCQVEMEENL